MVRSGQAYREIRVLLAEGGVEDAAFDANVLMEACGCSRLLDDEIEPEDWGRLRALAERRARREPLQYLLGRWPFLGVELLVGPGVLIPRPETEEVCAVAAGLLAERAEQIEWPGAAMALDLCSGGGALALGLQSFVPTAVINAVEKDSAALDYLRRNVEAFALGQSYENAVRGPEGEIRAPRVVEGDVFTYHRRLRPALLDVIVCNPPYVTEAEYASLAPELYHEPKQALVPEGESAQDGLSFYRAIARDYQEALCPGGWLVFEIGAAQSGAVKAILEDSHYEAVEIRQDLGRHDRIALGQRPEQ